MAIKRSVSGFCPHMQKNFIIAVWFRKIKNINGDNTYEKLDFECNKGYKSGCGMIKSCPVYNDATYEEK